MSEQEKKLPLEGIRVLEFTHAVMGPACGLLLADLGAEVIHIEPPGGDKTRNLKGFGTGYFPFYNRNKSSLPMNIKSDASRKAIEALVKSADVLVENFGPGTMERLGYGYTAMRELNPKLIYCSLKGFLSGPYENRTAMDEVVQMMGGLAYMTGPVGQPLRAGASVIDVSGGMFGAMGIITALYKREQTGEGEFVKAALFETTAFFMGQHMAYAALSDHKVPPMPARVSAWAVYRTFKTLDDQPVFVGIISEKHWASFCSVFNRPDLLEDGRYATNNDRITHSDSLLPDLEAMMLEHKADDIMERCAQVKIPYAPIACPEDLFDDPHLNEGNRLLEVAMPNGTTSKLPNIPLEYGQANFSLRSSPPSVGTGAEGVLASVGLSDSEIAEVLEG